MWVLVTGEGRGPVLEVIVSRANYISSYTSRKVRIIGLSTALANARDLADWLGIGEVSTTVKSINHFVLRYPPTEQSSLNMQKALHSMLPQCACRIWSSDSPL